MTTLPAEIDPEDQEIVDELVATCNRLTDLDQAIAAERNKRDAQMTKLRLKGWSARQVALLSGYSASGVSKIGALQGLVSTRSMTRRSTEE